MLSLVMFIQIKHSNLTGVGPASACTQIPALTYTGRRGTARNPGRESFEKYTATNSDTVRAFPDLW